LPAGQPEHWSQIHAHTLVKHQLQASYGVWKNMEKIGYFPAWKSLKQYLFWSVGMEKENSFPDLIF